MTARKPLDAGDRKLIKHMGASGFSKRAVARALGIGLRTFVARLKDDEEARAAWEAGRDEEEQALVATLFETAIDRKDPRSAISCMFLLKCRHGYRENAPPETEHAVRVTIELPAALQSSQYERLVDVERSSAKTAQIEAGE